MAEITAALVKDLRETTGAGMMDCKKALVETNGDKEAAIDWLRKKGLSAAAKKSGRVAAEGLVGVALAPGRAAMVEINAETDFVARNEAFQAYVETVAKLALDVGEDIEALKAAAYPGTGRSVADEAVHLVATIGENMNVRRVAVINVPGGAATAYIHGALKPGLGKIGVIVGLEGNANEALEQLGRQIGMHVAATRPDALTIAEVDPTALEREKNVLVEKARASGKPDAIIEKMVQGQVQKYYGDVVLLEQVWVHDGESKVKDVVKKAGANISRFVRFTLGEGIEKEVSDFAAEVAAAAGV
ncbi:MAG: elongation factor Ts [Rhodospirillales bacterium]|nr:elongation factor Ts [Rhodospirillales bacterium]